jgi:hypothetical protein
MFEKKFELSYNSEARTLNVDQVRGKYEEVCGPSTYTHADGWTISGSVSEDYYYWVNAFEASHPVFGRVWGDFETMVCADSEEGYNAFVSAHGPEVWDYYDI